MSLKTMLAGSGAALLLASAAPAGAQAAKRCPPGTPKGPYCVNVVIGLASRQHKATATPSGVVKLHVRCTLRSRCYGVLQLVGPIPVAKAPRHAKPKIEVLGKTRYKLAGHHTATLLIHLKPAARKALIKHRFLNARVVCLREGVRKMIDKLRINAR